MPKIRWDNEWMPVGRGNTLSVVEDGATPSYAPHHSRIFRGVQDPVEAGQTVMDGDLWLDPYESQTGNRSASDVIFSDAGLVMVTGVSSVQAALAKVDTRLDIPIAKGYRAAALSATNSAQDPIALDTQDYDTHGIFDPGTGIFTCPSGYAGLWRTTSVLSWATNTAGARTHGFSVNGVVLGNYMKVSASQSGSTVVGGTNHIYLDVGDEFQINGVQNSGGTLAYNVGAYANYAVLEFVRPM